MIMSGAKTKNPINASAVASPVIIQAQITSANLVMDVPSTDTIWPIQTAVNVTMPLFLFLRDFSLFISFPHAEPHTSMADQSI